MNALNKLRAGDTTNAIEILEHECFSYSFIVLSGAAGAAWQGGSFREEILTQLREYRHAYRTNQVEWTTLERKLEPLLVQKP